MFEGARLKVERADQHIHALERCLREFTENSFTTRPHASGMDITYTFLAPPSEVALIFGDAVHNLRSALDHLTWELDAAEEDRDPRLQFPVGKDRREFAKACRQVQSRTGRAALKALEAFPGGDGEALHSLSVLDNEDKHRRLSAVAQVPGVSNLRLVKDGTELRSLAEVFPGGMFAPGETSTIDGAPPNSYLQFRDNEGAFPHIVLDGTPCFASQPVLLIAKHLRIAVSHTISAVARELASEPGRS